GEPVGSQLTSAATATPPPSTSWTTSLALIVDGKSLLKTSRTCVPPSSPGAPDSGGVNGAAAPAASGSLQKPAGVHEKSGFLPASTNCGEHGLTSLHAVAVENAEPGTSSKSMAMPRTPNGCESCTMMRTSCTGPPGSCD